MVGGVGVGGSEGGGGQGGGEQEEDEGEEAEDEEERRGGKEGKSSDFNREVLKVVKNHAFDKEMLKFKFSDLAKG